MEEWISFLQTYSEILTGAAVVVLGLLLMIFLARILRQIKRLNRSLGSITGNMQAYFDVILREDGQIPEDEETENTRKLSQEQSKDNKALLMEQERRKQEEEKVFNAVLQEYFS